MKEAQDTKKIRTMRVRTKVLSVYLQVITTVFVVVLLIFSVFSIITILSQNSF